MALVINKDSHLEDCHAPRVFFLLFVFLTNLMHGRSRAAHGFHLQNDASLISRLLDLQPVFILNVTDLYPVSTRLPTDRYISSLWLVSNFWLFFFSRQHMLYISYSSPFMPRALCRLLGEDLRGSRIWSPPTTNWDVLYLQRSAVGLSSSSEKPCCAD